MEQYLKIGEMAQLNHVSTQTLRLYDKYKLLEPDYQDPNTGYRYYTLKQCVKLDLIHALKSCQLSLEEIRAIFEMDTPQEITEVLKKQEEVLTEEIRNLSISRNNLCRVQENLQLLNALPPLGIPFFEYLPERQVDVQHTTYDFYTQGETGYEMILREMQNYLFTKQLAPSYFMNIGTIIRREDFEVERYTSELAFVQVDDEYRIRDSVRTLPQGLYISIVSNDTSKELHYAHVLHEEIAQKNMCAVGDYVCEVISRFPLEQKQVVYKIQIPVSNR